MSGPSRDYSAMPRERAARHFDERTLKLKDDIRALPLPEKFRLIAEMLDAGAAVTPGVTLGVARLALAELEALPR